MSKSLIGPGRLAHCRSRQGRISLETPRCHCTPQTLYKYHIMHNITTYVPALQRLFGLYISKWSRVRTPWHPLFIFFTNSSYFIPKKRTHWGFEPAYLMSKLCTSTIKPVYNIAYFMILFNIYSINIWHPRKIYSRSATASSQQKITNQV
jgi:hypothetical protein